MSRSLVERVADALLFEGYMLYPYRPSAVKNQQRFNFGVIYPRDSTAGDTEGPDAHLMRTECLLEGNVRTTVDVRVRFLQLVQRTDARMVQPSWQEAVERTLHVPTISLGTLPGSPTIASASFEASVASEMSGVGPDATVITRRQQAIRAQVEVSVVAMGPQRFKLLAEIRNVSTPDASRAGSRDELLLHSMVSAHTILSVTGGVFISLLDPPLGDRDNAADCRGVRTWPVLVGEPEQRDTMLSSPIIIYDYPLIAPESAGDLFDGTEIDEILSLRILTMTDEEKTEMRQSDERARRLLERTEALGAEDLMRMHGTMRGVSPAHRESA